MSTELPPDIVISTRTGESFPAGIEPPGDLEQLERKQKLILKSVPSASNNQHFCCVARPDSSYNCAGMVFASRRAFVHPENLSIIYEHDSYQIVEQDVVRVGDIAIWRNGVEITHVGLVVRTIDELFRTPLVLSKWGMAGEFVHRVNDVPPDYGANIEFWRIDRDDERS